MIQQQLQISNIFDGDSYNYHRFLLLIKASCSNVDMSILTI